MRDRTNSPGRELGDEALNAFVDGQLPAADAAAIRSAIRSDEGLRSRIECLWHLKALVREAYRQTTPAD